MENIIERMKQLNMDNVTIEEIDERFTSRVYRLTTNQGRFIYKRVTNESSKELKFYQEGQPIRYIPIVACFNDAVLMKDCGLSMKNRRPSQIEVIEIFKALLDLQKTQIDHLSDFPLDEIERTWLMDQLAVLNIEELSYLKRAVNDAYEQLKVKDYQSVLPQVLTHGDFHLGNIFKTDKIHIIDWERAVLSSPVHDATMLIQDLNDKEWFFFYRDTYSKLLAMDYLIEEKQFQKEFNVYLLINTVKMMVWEISKYEQGWQSRNILVNKINQKMQLISLSLSKSA